MGLDTLKRMPTSEERKPVVLSADDDENAQFLLRRAFDKGGVKASLKEARDGTDVLQYLAGEGAFSDRAKYPWPDLLLLDLKMPRMTGFGVLEVIRKNPSYQTFPVVVFSSSDNADDLRKAYELGCHSYVVKPVEFQKLGELVRALAVEFLQQKGTNGSGIRPPAFSRFVAPAPNTGASEVKLAGLNLEEKGRPRTPPPTSPETFKSLVEQV